MKLSDFRLGWRLLAQQPAYSAIMVGGLSLGFAVCLLVLIFAKYCFNYNSQVPNIGDVYVVKVRPNWGASLWSEVAPLPMKETLVQSGLPLAVTGVVQLDSAMRVGAVVQRVSLTLVDSDFVTVFGTKALEGDLQAALTGSNTLALTAQTARRLFGDTHVLGRIVQINGQPFQVMALLNDPPDDSSVKYEVLAGMGSQAWPDKERQKALDLWSYYDDGIDGASKNFIYLRMKAGVKPKFLADVLTDMVERSPLREHLTAKVITELGQKKLLQVALGPLADSYLDSEARHNSGPKGDRAATFAMIGVALLILFLTAGNYISLATIRTIARQREMAIRKIVGVSGARLVAQMLAESLLVSLLAAGAGMLLAWLLLPAWADFTNMKFASVLGRGDWLALLLIGLVMGAVVGLATGVYPAWTVLKMRMLDALGGRGNSESTGGLWLRRVITVLQFGIAMFVSAMIITISWQIEFLKHIDFGYEIDALIRISMASDMAEAEMHSFRDALARLPGITGVAATSEYAANEEIKTAKAQTVEMGVLRVSAEYFSTIGLGVSAGRLFDPKIDSRDNASAIVVNGVAAQRLGYATADAALGQLVSMHGKSMQIVGVCKDINQGFNPGPIRGVIYEISPVTSQLMVNGGSDLAGAKDAIEQLWRQHFPNRYLFLSAERRQQELNASGPIEIMTACIVIAAIMAPLAIFSIYILSAHAVQRRAREIVMRKLYGAERTDIARFLGREFVALIAIAAVIGLPPAYLAGRMFMQQFLEQAPIGLCSVVGALFGAAVVAALATMRHTLLAIRISPATVLRNA